MESDDFLRNAIQQYKGIAFKNYTELADKAGVNQGNLSNFMKPDGDPKQRKNITFESAWKILTFLGYDPFLMKKVQSNAEPKIATHNEQLLNVPVIGETGAGDEIELFDASPDFWISVPPQFFHKGIVAFRVRGDSMEPKIRMGSYVGVLPFDGNLQEGGIYLINIEPFGRVIKRVYTDENGNIVLASENPKYVKRTLPYEGYEKVILGLVIWSLQSEWTL